VSITFLKFSKGCAPFNSVNPILSFPIKKLGVPETPYVLPSSKSF